MTVIKGGLFRLNIEFSFLHFGIFSIYSVYLLDYLLLDS